MTTPFREYRPQDTGEVAQAWKDGLFVADANVLLNLYRYSPDAAKELQQALNTIQDRAWTPHQIALEFYRNRTRVIVDQRRKFDAVIKVIRDTERAFETALDKLQLKKRHSIVDPNKLLAGASQLFSAQLSDLESLRPQLLSANDGDPILTWVDSFLSERTGAAPDQRHVDTMTEIARKRFSLSIPPGYSDKSKPDDSAIYYRGVTFRARYGDYYLWRELLDHAKKTTPTAIVFITDDRKDDWWQMTEGKRTPRVELISEILSDTGCPFLMYTVDGFLSRARTELGLTISDQSIQEAHDIGELNSRLNTQEAFDDLHRNLSDLVDAFAADLVNSDDIVTSAMAETNAYAFGLDEYHVVNTEHVDTSTALIEVELTLTGESDPDKMWCGDQLFVVANLTIARRADCFEIADYSIERCESNAHHDYEP